jgi:hypothetical protein
MFPRPDPLNRDHAQALLFDYIETFYNPKRLHLEFEKQFFTEKLAVTPLLTSSVDQASKRNKWGVARRVAPFMVRQEKSGRSS